MAKNYKKIKIESEIDWFLIEAENKEFTKFILNKIEDIKQLNDINGDFASDSITCYKLPETIGPNNIPIHEFLYNELRYEFLIKLVEHYASSRKPIWIFFSYDEQHKHPLIQIAIGGPKPQQFNLYQSEYNKKIINNITNETFIVKLNT